MFCLAFSDTTAVRDGGGTCTARWRGKFGFTLWPPGRDTQELLVNGFSVSPAKTLQEREGGCSSRPSCGLEIEGQRGSLLAQSHTAAVSYDEGWDLHLRDSKA